MTERIEALRRFASSCSEYFAAIAVGARDEASMARLERVLGDLVARIADVQWDPSGVTFERETETTPASRARFGTTGYGVVGPRFPDLGYYWMLCEEVGSEVPTTPVADVIDDLMVIHDALLEGFESWQQGHFDDAAFDWAKNADVMWRCRALQLLLLFANMRLAAD